MDVKLNIIGFTGTMGSGKSTATSFILDRVENSKLIKFAQPLYDMQEYIYKRMGLEPVKNRTLLQFLGTDFGRNQISDTVWVDLFKKDAVTEAIKKSDILILVDDVRFNNEAETIKKLGGVIVKLESTKQKDRIELINTSHVSEKGVDEAYLDAVIKNDGSLDDFKINLLNLLTVYYPDLLANNK